MSKEKEKIDISHRLLRLNPEPVLKPCPFCGIEPCLKIEEETRASDRGTATSYPINLKCPKCGAHPNYRPDHFVSFNIYTTPNEEEIIKAANNVIKRWNTRHRKEIKK